MSIQIIEASELLSLNRFEVDEEEPHIVLDKEICKTKCKEKTVSPRLPGRVIQAG